MRRQGRQGFAEIFLKKGIATVPRKEKREYEAKKHTNTSSPRLIFLPVHDWSRLGAGRHAAMDGLHGPDACFSPGRAMSPQVRQPPAGPPDIGG